MKPLYLLTIPLTAACASYPPPSDHLASAIAETRGAQVAGAQQVPRAALYLKLADEQIAQAKQMMQSGDNERADYMTLRAYNDAEVALAIAREDAARKRAEQIESEASGATSQNGPNTNQSNATAKP